MGQTLKYIAMHPVFSKLACASLRRDEILNIQLANELAKSKKQKEIQILMNACFSERKEIQHDAIKVLYEIGALNPQLIQPYTSLFVDLLKKGSSRMYWGAMIALQFISLIAPKEIYQYLPAILDAMNKGSVIAKDHGMKILVALAKMPGFTKKVMPLILEQLLVAPMNQFPTYVEISSECVNKEFKIPFLQLIGNRLDEDMNDTKRKRLQKVIKQLNDRLPA